MTISFLCTCTGNVPFLVIRIYLSANHQFTESTFIFIIKNAYGIVTNITEFVHWVRLVNVYKKKGKTNIPDAFEEEEEEEDESFWALRGGGLKFLNLKRRRMKVFEFCSEKTPRPRTSSISLAFSLCQCLNECRKNETYHYCSCSSIYCAPMVFQGCYLYTMWKSTDCQRIGADKTIQGPSVTTWPLDLGTVIKADFSSILHTWYFTCNLDFSYLNNKLRTENVLL